MADVYEAARLGPGGFRKAVALKQLRLDGVVDARAIKRFLREARIAAQLDHPNIVRVYDLLAVDHRHLMVMELLRGRDLSDLCGDLWPRRIPLPYVLTIAAQLLDGIDYAHTLVDDEGRPLGLLHRDLTPHNVFICSDGTVKILDFGIAKLMSDATAITAAGRIAGTAAFLSPEQAIGRQVDGRSDLYQVGAIAYFALAGRPPHGSGSRDELIERASSQPPPGLDELRPDLPRDVIDLVMRALACDREQRFAHARAMHSAVLSAAGGVLPTPAMLAGFL